MYMDLIGTSDEPKDTGDYDSNHAFLGRGWGFPVSVDKVTGRVQETEYEQSIRDSIYIIIMTKKGERVMRPDFGCDIYNYMFDAIDYTTVSRMRRAVEEAIIRWEPRITDLEVQIEEMPRDDNVVQIAISYRVRTTNNPFNLVFPFYLQEG